MSSIVRDPFYGGCNYYCTGCGAVVVQKLYETDTHEYPDTSDQLQAMEDHWKTCPEADTDF